MHRTEGENHSSNSFTDGPPGTTIEQNWLNAIQEEIANVIEDAGITLKTAATDSQDQLLSALKPGVATFGATDATPSVAGYNVFRTGTSGLTITDFDDGEDGKIITVISKAAIVFDTTGTNLYGSSVDITTASGDVTQWVCDGGTNWRLIGFVDASVDNSGGA